MNKHAYILFTRVPVPNKVKTRLQSLLSGEEACQVQLKILQDSFLKFDCLSNEGIDLYLAYSDEGDPTSLLSILPNSFTAFPQKGQTIGQRMNHAMKYIAAQGYDKVVLTGSDIPNLNSEIIAAAFDQMREVVLGPSPDGGYYLIGCSQEVDLTPIFETDITWGKSEVLNETLARLTGLEVGLLPQLQDIDFPIDLKKIRYELKEENHHFQHWLKENRGLLE